MKIILYKASPITYKVVRNICHSIVGNDSEKGISHSHKIVVTEDVNNELLKGWQDKEATIKQHQIYTKLINNMKKGDIRFDFQIAAQALKYTGMKNPSFIEIGCGSGYYNEILNYLCNCKLKYIGVDYSTTMIEIAKKYYSDLLFFVCDAGQLPFRNRLFDIAWSGASLMHLYNWKMAIKEMSRVAKEWCVFRSVPVIKNDPTIVLTKRAYGSQVVEIIFNENELINVLHGNKLKVSAILQDMPYNVGNIITGPIFTNTYICEVTCN